LLITTDFITSLLLNGGVLDLSFWPAALALSVAA